MKSYRFIFFVSLVVVICGLEAIAQSNQSASSDHGVTEVETFQGTFNSEGNLLKLDSALGYDFNKHFGVFTGLPVYFTSTPSSTSVTTTSSSSTTSGIGNAYVGFSLRAAGRRWSLSSTPTAFAPTGSTAKGYSTGRVTADWSNRIDLLLHRFNPFITAGFGNTVPDSALLTRAFTSLGAVSHLEEGAEFEAIHHVFVGGSAYQILPTGNQKVYSKIVAGQSAPVVTTKGAPIGQGHQPPVFETSAVASGTGLTRENGFSTWAAFQPNAYWRAAVGYARSSTFDLNSVAFNLSLNVGNMLRSKSNQ